MQTYSHMVKLLVYLTQIIGLKKKKKNCKEKLVVCVAGYMLQI